MGPGGGGPGWPYVGPGGGGSSAGRRWVLLQELLVKAGAEEGLPERPRMLTLAFLPDGIGDGGGHGPARRAGGDAAPGAGASCRAKGARRTGTAPAPRRGVAPKTESRTTAQKGWVPAVGRGGGPARPAAGPPASRAAQGGWWGARRGPPGQSPRQGGWLLSPGAG